MAKLTISICHTDSFIVQSSYAIQNNVHSIVPIVIRFAHPSFPHSGMSIKAPHLAFLQRSLNDFCQISRHIKASDRYRALNKLNGNLPVFQQGRIYMEIPEDGASQHNFKRVKWNPQRDQKHYYIDNREDETPLIKRERLCADYHNNIKIENGLELVCSKDISNKRCSYAIFAVYSNRSGACIWSFTSEDRK